MHRPSDAPSLGGESATLAARLRAARERLGYSQDSFASLIEMPLPSLKNYEEEKRAPGAGSMEKFVKGGINANWLLAGITPMLLAERSLAGDVADHVFRGPEHCQNCRDIYAMKAGARLSHQFTLLDSIYLLECALFVSASSEQLSLDHERQVRLAFRTYILLSMLSDGDEAVADSVKQDKEIAYSLVRLAHVLGPLE